MSKSKTAVLIINSGTPESPCVADVRKYLREFLMDARVIDIPFWRRFLLVHLIIAPFRAPESAKGYRQLWTAQGFPLKIYGQKLEGLLQEALGAAFEVKLAMRYQSPSIKSVLSQFKDEGFKQLIVIPLYPQYASSSSGSVTEEVMNVVKGWEAAPEIKLINQFFNHPLFIKAFVEIGKKYMAQERYDHYLFSYHGLPERQISQIFRLIIIATSAQCFETTRLLAKRWVLKKKIIRFVFNRV